MQSIFNPEAYYQITQRLAALSPQAQPLWGKMVVAQMLAHCSRSLEYRLSKFTLPLAPQPLNQAAKAILFNDIPYAKGAPTAQAFIIDAPCHFDTELQDLLLNLSSIITLGEAHPWPPHATFGALTGDEQGKSIYKHLDHHLRQFGA